MLTRYCGGETPSIAAITHKSYHQWTSHLLLELWLVNTPDQNSHPYHSQSYLQEVLVINNSLKKSKSLGANQQM